MGGGDEPPCNTIYTNGKPISAVNLVFASKDWGEEDKLNLVLAVKCQRIKLKDIRLLE